MAEGGADIYNLVLKESKTKQKIQNERNHNPPFYSGACGGDRGSGRAKAEASQDHMAGVAKQPWGRVR